MSPPQTMNSFSPRVRRTGASSGPTRQRAHDESQNRGEREPFEPDRGLVELAVTDREAERGERGDLGQRGERRVERLDLALARRGDVAEEHARDEDREEARPVRDRGEAVDHAGAGEHAKGIERRARQVHARITGSSRSAPATPTTRPTAISTANSSKTIRQAAVVLAGELDHPDHERDPDRVVRPGLALEDRPRAAANLPTAEHGERHGRIGRSDRGADQPGGDPREPEEVVRGERHEPGGEEGSDDAERENRDRRAAEAPEPDVQAAVEEDHDQRDDADALDGLDRERVAHRLGRARRASPAPSRKSAAFGTEIRSATRMREHGEKHARRDDEDDRAEIGDLAHSLNGQSTTWAARRDYSLLTRFSCSTHAESRYWRGPCGSSFSSPALSPSRRSLAVAAGAADPPTGVLSVDQGRGVVTLDVRGVVLGRLGTGSAARHRPHAARSVHGDRAREVPSRSAVGPRTVVYRGQGLRFRMVGGRYRIVIRGTGIAVSANARGIVILDGEPQDRRTSSRASTRSPATDCSLEPTLCTALPDEPQRFQLGGPVEEGDIRGG